MPKDFSRFKREIEREGYTVTSSKQGHWKVLTPHGKLLIMFAETHGSRSKRGEVFDHYVRQVMKAIRADQQK
jgi:hypothetical protein